MGKKSDRGKEGRESLGDREQGKEKEDEDK